MPAKKAAKKATKKATKKAAAKVDPKLKEVKASLKEFEAEFEFDYPEDPNDLKAHEELLVELQTSSEENSEEEEDNLGSEEEADETPEEEESDEDEPEEELEESDEDEDEDYDGDPNVARPKDLSKTDRARIDKETPEVDGDAVDVISGNEYVRTYSKKEHGKEFAKLATEFAEKLNEKYSERDLDRKAEVVDSGTIEQVFVVYRREVGKGDNRRMENQKVQFSLEKDGPKFKAMATALKVKVSNTPGQDKPGTVVLK